MKFSKVIMLCNRCNILHQIAWSFFKFVQGVTPPDPLLVLWSSTGSPFIQNPSCAPAWATFICTFCWKRKVGNLFTTDLTCKLNYDNLKLGLYSDIVTILSLLFEAEWTIYQIISWYMLFSLIYLFISLFNLSNLTCLLIC